MTSVMSRGLAAGAVGTALLNTATYVDMLLTGREASTAPGETVLRLARRAGLDPPGDDNRVQAYGQLGGLAAGLGVGVLASAVRRLGVRLPAPLGVAMTGAAAMAATDAPMAVTGADDPSTWSATDWLSDAVPHLAYGLGVHWTLVRMEAAGMPAALGSSPTTAGLLARSAILGLAAGARSSFGVLGPALSGGGAAAKLLTGAMAATELAVDKLPQAPSRLEPQVALVRLGTGAAGGAALARRESASMVLPGLMGAAGAAVGTLAGAAWRAAAADRGWTWQAALVEDGVALALVGAAVRGS